MTEEKAVQFIEQFGGRIENKTIYDIRQAPLKIISCVQYLIDNYDYIVDESCKHQSKNK